MHLSLSLLLWLENVSSLTRQKRSAFQTWRHRMTTLRRILKARLARMLQRLQRGRMGRRRALRATIEARKQQRRRDEAQRVKAVKREHQRRARVEKAVALFQANTENEASRKIARWLRRMLRAIRARREHFETRMVVRVQCAYRIKMGHFAAYMKRSARAAFDEGRQVDATLIQSVFRGRRCRAVYIALQASQHQQLHAALLLQSAMRKKISRVAFGLRFEKRKQAMRNKKDAERRNFVAMQKSRSEERAQKEKERARLQAKRLQNMQRNQHRVEYESAVLLQNMYRCGRAGAYVKALKYGQQLQASASTLQRFWRRRVWLMALQGRLALQLSAMLATQCRAVTLVQSAWRRNAAYATYQFHVDNARDFELRTVSTLTLQQAFRCRRARVALHGKKADREIQRTYEFDASRRVQNQFRGRMAKAEVQNRRVQQIETNRRLHLRRHTSAIRIQGMLRGKKGKNAAFARAASREHMRLLQNKKATVIQARTRGMYGRQLSSLRTDIRNRVKHEDDDLAWLHADPPAQRKRVAFQISVQPFLSGEMTWNGSPPSMLASMAKRQLHYDMHVHARCNAAHRIQNRWKTHRSALLLDALRAVKRQREEAERKGAVALQKAWRARKGRLQFSNYVWSVKKEKVCAIGQSDTLLQIFKSV
jgi:hypothetical protein